MMLNRLRMCRWQCWMLPSKNKLNENDRTTQWIWIGLPIIVGKMTLFFFAFLLKILFYFCMGITRKRETRGRVRVKSIDKELPNCVREKTRFYYTQSSWGKKYWISIATHRYFECNFPLLFREGMKYRSESSFVYNRIIEKGRWRNG